MNTLAMILTISGMSFCWVQGFFGWVGVAIALIGTLIAVRGMTNTKTSPSGLGMDTASYVFGPATLIYGTVFQMKFYQAPLDFLLVDMDFLLLSGLTIGFFIGFIALQLVGRKHLRWVCAGLAIACMFGAVFFGISALTIADIQGIKLS